MTIALDQSYKAHNDKKAVIGYTLFSTERAVDVGDFMAYSDRITVRRLSQSTCNQQHRGVPHFSVKVPGKYAVHIRDRSTVYVNGQQTTMRKWYENMLVFRLA